jgi:ribose transport system substrate-binding protein
MWFGVAVTVVAAGALAPAHAETIAVFTKNRNSPIFAALRAGANTAAKNLGVEAVQYVPSTADNVEQQAGLVDDGIKSKPDVIVFVPINPKDLIPAAQKIEAAGIPLINVNERLAGGKADAYVGTDDYELGLATARHLLHAMGGKGNVVILEGPETLPTSVGRVRGFNAALKEFPDVKLLASKPANYAKPQAAQVTKDLLKSFPQIDGVLAANDPMALGAIEALKAATRKALVVGINASREAIDPIKMGDLLASGDYNSFGQGCIGVEIAVRAARKQPAPKEVMLKPAVVDKTNYAPYEAPVEQRTCPTLESVAAK